MEKILLVNDCRFESLVMKDILKSLGYEVSITNEFEAMSEVREFMPDTLICNLIMKEIRGNVLIHKIKSLHPDMRCFLSSSSPISLNDYKKDKVDEVIHTPVSGEKLKELLQERQEKQKKRAFCPFCGVKLETLDMKSIFCPYCGSKL
jgi:two-component system, chemotaxis family, chemotaxis protein CheY